MMHSPHSEPTQPAIVWPNDFQPAKAVKFISNEVIAKNTNAQQVWTALVTFPNWNEESSVEETSLPRGLRKGDTFKSQFFSRAGLLNCTTREVVPPSGASNARLAWLGEIDDENVDLRVYHAWLIQDLGDGVVRILSQQSCVGNSVVDGSEGEDTTAEMLQCHQNIGAIVRKSREMKRNTGVFPV